MSSFDSRYHADNIPGNITIALYRIGQAISMMLRRKRLEHGLFPIRVQAFLSLRHARSGVRIIGGLFQRLGCTMATTGDVTDVLECKGLALHEPWLQHRRALALSLTSQGEDLAKQVDDALDKVEVIICRDGPRDVLGLWLLPPQRHPNRPVGLHHCAFINAPCPKRTPTPNFLTSYPQRRWLHDRTIAHRDVRQSYL